MTNCSCNKWRFGFLPAKGILFSGCFFFSSLVSLFLFWLRDVCLVIQTAPSCMRGNVCVCVCACVCQCVCVCVPLSVRVVLEEGVGDSYVFKSLLQHIRMVLREFGALE